MNNNLADKVIPYLRPGVIREHFVKILFFLAFGLAGFSFLKSYSSKDISIFYQYALNILQGQVPYRDFPIEYPPLALLPIVLPQLFNAISLKTQRGYELFFFIQNAAFILFIGFLVKVSGGGRRQLKEPAWYILPAYLLLVILLARILLIYFDLFPVIFTALALLAVVKNRPSLCGISLGLGTATKLYPVILLPVFSLNYIYKKQYQELAKLLVSFFSTLAVLLVLLLPIGWNNVFRFLQYHKLRGLHLESIPAGVLLLAHKLGWMNITLENNYGAIHLNNSAVTATIIQLLPPIFIFAFLLSMLSYWKYFQLAAKNSISNTSPRNHHVLVIGITLVILVFIVFNKVFSPQYLIWLIPFIPFLGSGQIVLFAVICGLNILVWPVFYDELMNLELLPILLLNCRNLLMLTLTFWILSKSFLSSSRRS